jgi:hypothetical protein
MSMAVYYMPPQFEDGNDLKLAKIPRNVTQRLNKKARGDCQYNKIAKCVVVLRVTSSRASKKDGEFSEVELSHDCTLYTHVSAKVTL